jgi:hypothetical protein
MPGNAEAWEMLTLGGTQARIGMGGFAGYDYLALARLADDMGIDTSPALWRKVRAVEGEVFKLAKEEKNGVPRRAG